MYVCIYIYIYMCMHLHIHIRVHILVYTLYLGMTAGLLLRDDYKDQKVSKFVSITTVSGQTTSIDPLSIKTTIETEITANTNLKLTEKLDDSIIRTSQIDAKENGYIILKTLYPEEMTEKIDQFLGSRL
jgi:hypothetical protein